MRKQGHEKWFRAGTLGKAFPIEHPDLSHFQEILLEEDEKQISDNFGRVV